MPPKMPTLGPQPKSPLPAVLKIALFVGLMSGGAYYVWTRRLLPESARQAIAARTGVPAPEPTAPVAPPPAPVPTAPASPDAATAAPIPAPAAPAPAAPAESALRHVHVTITGALEAAFVDALGKEVGPALTQVVTRTLVWWIEIPADLKKGDVIDVVFQERAGEEPEVHAVTFVSAKTGQTHRAYRYRAPGEPFARYYDPAGQELELRLKDGPLDDYEQITSLLRDGRRHKGVDFKTPVGTPVKAPFSGTVTRRNWNFRGNGNCLELTAADGSRKALFLHLDVLPKTLKLGDKVTAGQQIAHTGNSGRSFAPHLHYQLMRGEERVLDPFTVHGTYRRSLEASAHGGLTAAVQKLDGLMGALAASASP